MSVSAIPLCVAMRLRSPDIAAGVAWAMPLATGHLCVPAAVPRAEQHHLTAPIGLRELVRAASTCPAIRRDRQSRRLLDRGGGDRPTPDPRRRIPPVFLAMEIPMTAKTHARTAPGTAAKAKLKREFPGWRFIRSAQGRWWAQRFPVPWELFNEPNMVDADTPEALGAKLTGLAS